MRIIEHPDVKAFKSVARVGSVHAAARELGLTQTAITKRIQALERVLGVTLFLRSRRGMNLTSDGTALLQHCRAIDELEGVFLSRTSGKERSEIDLTILGPTSAISTRIVNDCRPLYAKYPYLRLHLRSDDHSDLIDLIRRGKGDLAVVPPESVPNEMESKVLKSDRYLLVASPEWKGRHLEEILRDERIIDFYPNDLTTTKYLKKFGLNSQVKKERLFINENEALIRLFSDGIGFGTLTDSVAKPHVDAGDLIVLNKGQT